MERTQQKKIPVAYRWSVGVTDPHLDDVISHLDKYSYDYRIGEYENWFGVLQTRIHFKRRKDADFVGTHIADRYAR